MDTNSEPAGFNGHQQLAEETPASAVAIAQGSTQPQDQDDSPTQKQVESELSIQPKSIAEEEDNGKEAGTEEPTEAENSPTTKEPKAVEGAEEKKEVSSPSPILSDSEGGGQKHRSFKKRVSVVGAKKDEKEKEDDADVQKVASCTLRRDSSVSPSSPLRRLDSKRPWGAGSGQMQHSSRLPSAQVASLMSNVTEAFIQLKKRRPKIEAPQPPPIWEPTVTKELEDSLEKSSKLPGVSDSKIANLLKLRQEQSRQFSLSGESSMLRMEQTQEMRPPELSELSSPLLENEKENTEEPSSGLPRMDMKISTGNEEVELSVREQITLLELQLGSALHSSEVSPQRRKRLNKVAELAKLAPEALQYATVGRGKALPDHEETLQRIASLGSPLAHGNSFVMSPSKMISPNNRLAPIESSANFSQSGGGSALGNNTRHSSKPAHPMAVNKIGAPLPIVTSTLGKTSNGAFSTPELRATQTDPIQLSASDRLADAKFMFASRNRNYGGAHNTLMAKEVELAHLLEEHKTMAKRHAARAKAFQDFLLRRSAREAETDEHQRVMLQLKKRIRATTAQLESTKKDALVWHCKLRDLNNRINKTRWRRSKEEASAQEEYDELQVQMHILDEEVAKEAKHFEMELEARKAAVKDLEIQIKLFQPRKYVQETELIELRGFQQQKLLARQREFAQVQIGTTGGVGWATNQPPTPKTKTPQRSPGATPQTRSPATTPRRAQKQQKEKKPAKEEDHGVPVSSVKLLKQQGKPVAPNIAMSASTQETQSPSPILNDHISVASGSTKRLRVTNPLPLPQQLVEYKEAMQGQDRKPVEQQLKAFLSGKI